MRLEFGKVELDQLIVLCSFILLKFSSVSPGKITDGLSLGSLEILVHAVVEWEDRRCCTNLSTLLSDVSVDAGLDGEERPTILHIVPMPVALMLSTPGPK